MLRSLGFRSRRPTASRFGEGDAPDLFELLSEVDERIAAPRVHRVLVDQHLNAGFVQVPRFAGLLGKRNYLVLGFR